MGLGACQEVRVFEPEGRRWVRGMNSTNRRPCTRKQHAAALLSGACQSDFRTPVGLIRLARGKRLTPVSKTQDGKGQAVAVRAHQCKSPACMVQQDCSC